MQHLKYWTSASKLHSYEFNWLRMLFRTNIKMPYRVPKSAIHYSERYNSGEDFLLHQKTFFPFWYNGAQFSLDTDQGHQINVYASNINELLYCYLNEASHSVVQEVKSNCRDGIELARKLTLADTSSLPAASLANILYLLASADKLNINLDSLYHSNENKTDYLAKIANNFSSKAEFADIDSLCRVHYALNKLIPEFDRSQVESLINSKKFAFEHTQVEMTLPHLFSYREVKPSKLVNLLTSKAKVNPLAEKLFDKGKFVTRIAPSLPDKGHSKRKSHSRRDSVLARRDGNTAKPYLRLIIPFLNNSFFPLFKL